VGRGKGDGQGLIKLSQVPSVERTFINAGKVQVQSLPGDPWIMALQKQAPLNEASTEYMFKLTSEEPFVVVGPGLGRVAADGEKGVNNKLRALRRDAKTPELPGTSLMGVLKARADWWSRIEVQRGAMTEDDRQRDMRRLFGADADKIKMERTSPGIKSNLTGFAGILKLHKVTPTKTMPVHELHSVKVDRFSMGPFDSGLFSVEAFPKPSFDVVLYLDDRANGADRTFMERFVVWLQAKGPSGGLMLGHGSNRGFGWFDLTAEKV
jgi:hypothetical protein